MDSILVSNCLASQQTSAKHISKGCQPEGRMEKEGYKIVSSSKRSLTTLGIIHPMHANRGSELDVAHVLRRDKNILLAV